MERLKTFNIRLNGEITMTPKQLVAIDELLCRIICRKYVTKQRQGIARGGINPQMPPGYSWKMGEIAKSVTVDINGIA